jgi:3-hydroxyacyl-CoA dehydrogenase
MGHGSIVFEGTPAIARERRHAQGVARGLVRPARHPGMSRRDKSRPRRRRDRPVLKSNDRSIFLTEVRRNSSMTAQYKVHGDVAVITLNNPPVNGLGHTPPAWASPTVWRARPGRCRRSRRSSSPAPARPSRAAPTSRSSARPRRCRAQPAQRDPGDRGEHQAGRRRHPQVAWAAGWSWRWAATTASPRPGAGRAAGGEARADSRRRRHAAPAARARRRDRAEHDRQRRAGQERTAGQPAGPEAVRQDGRGRPRWPKRRWPSRRGGRCRPAAAGARPEGKHPLGDAYLQFARNMVKAHVRTSRRRCKCVDAVEAATKKKFDAGMVQEREIFTALMFTPECKALRHLFLAERARARSPTCRPTRPSARSSRSP